MSQYITFVYDHDCGLCLYHSEICFCCSRDPDLCRDPLCSLGYYSRHCCRGISLHHGPSLCGHCCRSVVAVFWTVLVLLICRALETEIDHVILFPFRAMTYLRLCRYSHRALFVPLCRSSRPCARLYLCPLSLCHLLFLFFSSCVCASFPCVFCSFSSSSCAVLLSSKTMSQSQSLTPMMIQKTRLMTMTTHFSFSSCLQNILVLNFQEQM